MPILNYSCASCGNEFPKLFFDIKHAPKTCPVCDSGQITEKGNAFEVDRSAYERLATESCDSCDSCDSCEDHSKKTIISSCVSS